MAEQKLRLQHNTLVEIAVMQSHQVRVSIANILGLIELFNLDKPHDPLNAELISKLKKVTVTFDTIIRGIVQKTVKEKEITGIHLISKGDFDSEIAKMYNTMAFQDIFL